MKREKKDSCTRRCWRRFCVVFFCRKNLYRDLAIVVFLLALLPGIFYLDRHGVELKGIFSQEKRSDGAVMDAFVPEPEMERTPIEIVAAVQQQTDTSSWTRYQNLWYGFVLKYPQEWADPVIQKAPAGALWEQKIRFRSPETSPENPFAGFDVVVYPVARAKELSKTDEFPKIKSVEMVGQPDCSQIEGHLIETGDYPAEEIYIPIDDDCYNATLFFSDTRGEYIYNLVPALKDGAGLAGDPSQEIVDHLPDFFSAISTFELIDIQRPKPAPPKPKITAPKPVSFKKDGQGRLVCEKGSKDKPGKSNKGKGKHLDMECCLDPDEYPNPWCYYPPEKYGKYL